jgi:hypothetical protein
LLVIFGVAFEVGDEVANLVGGELGEGRHDTATVEKDARMSPVLRRVRTLRSVG